MVAKIELGEGDAGIVYVTDAKASDKVTTVDVPDAANVPATYDGVVVKASTNAAAAKAFLDWFAGPDGQAILADLGFLPPARDRRLRRGPAADTGTWPVVAACTPRSGRWGERSIAALAGLFALFLGLPVARPGRPVDPRWVARASRSASPAVLEALWLSLVTTAISLVVTVFLGLPLAIVLARRQFRGKGCARGDRRPAHRAAAVGRRPRAAPGLRAAWAAVGAVRVLGISVPFTTIAVILAQIFVVGAVLHPVGADRDRRRRTAISRMPPGSTARPSGSCSGRSRCRSPARRSQPGS